MKSTVDILREAREFLSDETHWLRDGNYARDADGEPLDPDSRDEFERAATCCAIGACMFAAKTYKDSASGFLRKALRRQHGSTEVASWNDEQATHPELLALFDKAIELAEQL